MRISDWSSGVWSSDLPLFHWLGVTGGENIGMGAAIGVLLVYVALGVVAVAIDRRALLVSALAYVLAALTFLFDRFGAVELNVALTALVIDRKSTRLNSSH